MDFLRVTTPAVATKSVSFFSNFSRARPLYVDGVGVIMKLCY